MRSAHQRPLPADDLTTRARIRDAAVLVFARDGFGATVRAVAAAAGVSPGLVIHHFGSKAGLRAACDEHVLRVTRDANRDAVAPPAPASAIERILAQMDDLGSGAERLLYLLRSLQDSGPATRDLLDHLVADAEVTLRAGVAAGTVVPSRDEAARARFLVAQSLGTMLVDLVMHPPAQWSDTGAVVGGHVARILVPATEYAVHGVMADESLLDAVLAWQEEHGEAHA